MGYHIQLYSKATREKYEAEGGSYEFLEDKANLQAFSEAEKADLEARLLRYGYAPRGKSLRGLTRYEHEKYPSVEILLGESGLYFSARGEDVFEISMTSSELTDDARFAKFDPQDGGWES